uniref:Uncharacterized protein n=1 Tax=viral metagenome TaxID=1070528 RepID=A0A6M3LUY1_9ZZZZ
MRLLNSTGLVIFCFSCDKKVKFRYLDCENCKEEGIPCIYVCTECGTEVTPIKLKQIKELLKQTIWRIK